MGCIETILILDSLHLLHMLNSNMGCIETFQIYSKVYKTNELNSNMGCIETNKANENGRNEKVEQ